MKLCSSRSLSSSHSLSSSSFPAMALCSVSFLVIFIIRSAEGIIQLPENMKIPAVLVFGDSIVDQGNNNHLKSLAKSNFPPYGKDFMGGVPTGRFCNGKTPSDLIAEELGIKELVGAYLDPNLPATELLTGVSFASGGTGFDPQTPQLATVYSLSDQVKMFREYIGKVKGLVGEEETNFILTNTLYLVVAGSDDLANTYFAAGIRRLQYDINSYTDFMVRSASDFVKELYQLGAKRVAFFGIPPIGCLPSQRTLAGGGHRACAENFNQAGKLFNTKISSELDSLSKSLDDALVRLVYIDIYNPLIDLIQNHDKYGFAIVDKGCCGTGKIEAAVLCNQLSVLCLDDTQYLFWDSYHPTEKAYKVIVNLILQNYIDKFLRGQVT